MSKPDFYLGLNVSLPVNQWYFVPCGSQTPSLVALHAFGGKIQSNYANPETSLAYFGFDERATLLEFVTKYDKFVVNVEKKKFVLKVSEALYQSMPSPDADAPAKDQPLEDSEDFKYFETHVLNARAEPLLPLEMQLQLERDKARLAYQEALP